MLKSILSYIHTMLHVYKVMLQQLPTLFRHPKLFGAGLMLKFLFYWDYFKVKKEKKDLGLSTSSLTQGNTPFLAIDQLLDTLSPSPKSTFIDCGSSQGWLCFYLSQKYRFTIIGVEAIKTYVQHSIWVKKFLGFKNCQFRQKDFLTKDFFAKVKANSILYITLTCFDADSIKVLSDLCQYLPKECHVVTATLSLKSPYLLLEGKQNVLFEWGKSELFIYRSKN